MASPDYNNQSEEVYQYDLDDWTFICQYCLKTISATRPPVFNEVNCGCSERGTHAAGLAPATRPNTYPMTTVYNQPVYTYQQPSPGYHSSYTHTSTVTQEESPVREARDDIEKLNISQNNGYRRTDSNMVQAQPYTVQKYSWPLRAWLKEEEPSYSSSSIPRSSSRFHKSTSTKAQKGSKHQDSGIHDYSSDVQSRFNGWGPDPFTETGAWTSTWDEKYQEGRQYPLAISGLSESVEK